MACEDIENVQPGTVFFGEDGFDLGIWESNNNAGEERRREKRVVATGREGRRGEKVRGSKKHGRRMVQGRRCEVSWGRRSPARLSSVGVGLRWLAWLCFTSSMFWNS